LELDTNIVVGLAANRQSQRWVTSGRDIKGGYKTGISGTTVV